MNVLLKYLELILSAIGVLVAFAVPLFFFREQHARWEAAAVTAAAVGVIHGLIFYVVRSRQRQLRQATIHEMQVVVDDIVRNQMTVVSLSAALDLDSATAIHHQVWAQRSIDAAHEIAKRLNQIDSERLRDLISRRPH